MKQRFTVRRRIAVALTSAAAATALFTGTATAAPAAQPADPGAAASGLRAAAAGNADAEAAIERLIASPQDVAKGLGKPVLTLPGQIFPVPAYSDTGQGGEVLGQLYGSGVATNMNNEFRFGFFGGPGSIADNQTGAELNVVWYSLANGTSGITRLDQNNKIVPTVISTAPLNVGKGMVVGAVYGSLWHKVGPKPEDVVKSTIWMPSMGMVMG
ncbi:Tat pathway signal protein [Rhodococcus oryzae]|uniref:Tat pathway signal protein n=1 Tax=Rhodococcus oryzae TaxID=2571143 RepID=A0ABY2REL7_9NOCA|nr:Tat pathway signal protein [Rhodococcus oryzae]TJZ74364.1 Tat pathway signal protein [Rhodococcus oryzae]